MILVFGGTTEGRKTVEELEEAGRLYYYSTKGGEQDVALNHGVRVDGAMDAQAMQTFCVENEIRLIVDAAHSFAQNLHGFIADTAQKLRLPVIRFERIYTTYSEGDIVWCRDFDDAVRQLSDIRSLLVTTGVQTIAYFKVLEERGVRVLYRILPRESSLRIAREQGIDDTRLCFYRQNEDEVEVFKRIRPEAVVMKESGISGGFDEKVRAARQLGIQIFAISRPLTSPSFHVVNGPHGLRRMVEKLLPEFYPLHSGLTTGTYAAAVALAAAIRLLHHETPEMVPVYLPDGETIHIPVHFSDNKAVAVKDSGDDPDVTNGIEICAKVELLETASDSSTSIEIVGGEGVGTITLPGFDYSPGSPAINKVPREMIRENIYRRLRPSTSMRVTISIPKGRELARRTFNPRLGIVDGISVVGVSGIIKPFSKMGFLDSIRKCMDVAKATGCDHVVINSGAKSERFIKAYYPDLSSQVFVQYGNFIGDTIRMAFDVGFSKLTLGMMLGKAVKLAAGNLDTHSREVTMDKGFIVSMVCEVCDSPKVIEDVWRMNLARELWKILPSKHLQDFVNVLIRHCESHCCPLFLQGNLTVILIDDEGRIYSKTE